MAFETINDNVRFTQTIVGDISATGNVYSAGSLVGGGGGKTKLTGNGTTQSFSIHGASTNAAAYRVDINGVVQEPTVGASVGDYSISAPGTILFSTAPANGTKIIVIG